LPDKHLVKARIEDIGIIPSVRTVAAGDARFAAVAISDAGIPLVEIATTVDGALAVIVDLVRSMPDLMVGADVLDVETARRAIGAGASFITSPCCDRRVIELARKENVLVIPGALTPTEVRAAWEAGADFVKVFPCAPLGGERYIRALKAPLSGVPLVASGGVNQQTVTDFVRAGAIAVGIGAALIPAKAIRHRRPDWIAELARRFLILVHEAREQVATVAGKTSEHVE
jgi:2-dehydro-3-deoxyphosphogluconate aldolase/(4S)-4-hydroxy-2-oxoglutarate aldolase